MRRILFMIAALAITKSFAAPSAAPFTDDDRDVRDLLQFAVKQARLVQDRAHVIEDAYWLEAQKVARRRGLSLIEAVMKYLRKYPASEDTLPQFASLCGAVELLPRPEAVKILHKYEQSDSKIDRDNARDLLIEFDMSDTKEAVTEFLAKHP